jgi:UPF0271 protein
MLLDLNCDLGEGCPSDAELIPLITTANVACGFHAGGPSEAFAVLKLAKKHGVRVGAHPSFPDREHFGRHEMARSRQQVLEDCVYQIGALAALAKAAGMDLSHVKPHGALYNMACRDPDFARPIVQAAALFGLPLMGLPGSWLQTEAEGRCPFVAEGYADRRYQPDGSLVPRSQPGAFVETPAEAIRQAAWLVRDKGIRTLCVHGDNRQALALVRELREALIKQGVEIRAFA